MSRPAFSAVLALGLFTGPAMAADAIQGERLARAWCTDCHQVSAGSAATDAAPPFPALAAKAADDPAALRRWLADPHPPMPNLNLGTREIEDLIAYLRSLKTP